MADMPKRREPQPESAYPQDPFAQQVPAPIPTFQLGQAQVQPRVQQMTLPPIPVSLQQRQVMRLPPMQVSAADGRDEENPLFSLLAQRLLQRLEK
jgi:hypothetical protein